MMEECYKIRDAEKLFEFLRYHGIEDTFGFDYQLRTNYGFVYTVPTGEVVFMPNLLRGEGLICKDKTCFDALVAADNFPIQNPGANLYDTEIAEIKTINHQIEHYRKHLNKILKFDFADVDKIAAQAYLKKVIGRTIKKLTTNTDLVALIAIIGEIIRVEIGGKWVIEKWYGVYNPNFRLRILTPDNILIFIDDKVLGNIKWKVSNIDTIIGFVEGVDLDTRRKNHECTVLED
jgi:hypothetical protein